MLAQRGTAAHAGNLADAVFPELALMLQPFCQRLSVPGRPTGVDLHLG